MGSFFNCILSESAVAKSDADEALDQREWGVDGKGDLPVNCCVDRSSCR
jgi:hypothetical protein